MIPASRAMVDDLRALRTASPPAADAPSRVMPFEPRAATGAAVGTPGRSTASRRWLLPAGLAAGGSGGPAPVAALDAGCHAAIAGAAAAVTGAAPPVRAGRSRVAGADGDVAGRRSHRRADERRDAGRLSTASAVTCGSRLSETLREGRLPVSPRAADTVARAGELMSDDVRTTPFVPIGPRATAVSSATPARSSGPRSAAQPPTGSGSSTSASPPSPSASRSPTLTWRPEAPLPSRRVLSWQVEATTPDGPAHHARAAARRGALHGADADRTAPGSARRWRRRAVRTWRRRRSSTRTRGCTQPRTTRWPACSAPTRHRRSRSR